MRTLVPGVLSGFVSDIATVLLFLPQQRYPPFKVALPIAIAALAGENLTIIGASHNLVANDLLQSSGQSALGFFEIAPAGIAPIISFIIYTLVIGQGLLPGLQAVMHMYMATEVDQSMAVMVIPTEQMPGQTSLAATCRH